MFVDLGCVMEIEGVLLRNTHNADNDNYAEGDNGAPEVEEEAEEKEQT